MTFDPYENRLPVAQSPVQEVRMVSLRERFDLGSNLSASRPGHLLQLTLTGQSWHEVSGRTYLIKPGNVMWFHEVEPVRLDVRQVPWRFIAINFIAPSLGPPPFDKRLCCVKQSTMHGFEQLLNVWNDSSIEAFVRQRLVRGWLELILADIGQGIEAPCQVEPTAWLWWELEARLRERMCERFTLDDLASLSRRSPATVTRICRAATGMTPMRRVKQIRLELARAMVQQGTQSISDVAMALGYPRVHEFSRDYHQRFGRPPSSDRYSAKH